MNNGDTIDQKRIGNFISTLRKEKKLTQEQLAEKIGINSRTISKWERGLALPEYMNIEAISTIFEVTISEIFAGERNNIDYNPQNDKEIIKGLKFYNYIYKKRILFISLLMIIILAFTTFFCFFISNYNKCKVYSLTSNEENYLVKGYIVYNQKENIIILNEMKLQNEFVGTSKEPQIQKASIYMMYNSQVIFNIEKNYDNELLSDVFNNISFSIEDNKENNVNIINDKTNTYNLKIFIQYTDVKDEETIIEIPIKIKERFANNKIL